MPVDFFDASIFQTIPEDWRNVLPFLVLCGGVFVATLAAAVKAKDCFLRVICAGALLSSAALFFVMSLDSSRFFLGSSMEVGPFERLVAGSICILGFLSALYTKSPAYRAHSEWAALLLLCVLGAILLPTARNWIAVFVYLEMLSIPAYLLSALQSDKERSLEASMKYLMMGAFVSAFLLLGIGLFYGVTATFSFEHLASALPVLSAPQQLICFAGAMLVFSAMAFKVSLFPFHMWAADVYQAAPPSIAAFLAGATKLSVFSALIFSFEACGFWNIPGLSVAAQILGVFSVVFGAVLAMAQTGFRRMLAYSGVVNAGLVTLLLPYGTAVYPQVFVFLIIYALSVAACFAAHSAALASLGRSEEQDLDISSLLELKGRTSLVVLVAIAFSLLSLAGIPPLPGFFSKYFLISVLAEQSSFALLAVALLGTLLGLGFYLRGLVPLCLYPTISTQRDAAAGNTMSNAAPRAAAVLAVLCATLFVLGFGFLQRLLESAELLAK